MNNPDVPSPSSNYVHKARFFQERASRWLDASFTGEELRRLEALLSPFDLGEGQTILEPGCGGGRLTSWLAERVGETGQVVACDLSERLLRGARERVRANNVLWKLGPVEELELREGSLDRVLCFQSFPHFEDQAGILERFFRWTRPGGKLAILHLISRERVNAIHRSAGEAVGSDVLPSGQEITGLLTAAGWTPSLISDGAEEYAAMASKQDTT